MVILSFLFGSCTHSTKIRTVDKVDLDRYAGKWYEIASIPTPFQKGCECTTAEYTVTGKRFIRVTNSCKVGDKFKKIQGKAFVTKGSNNSKLKVQFYWPFRGSYWIVDLDDGYQWAVVSNPKMKYLWILSRKARMDETQYSHILDRIKAQGFNIEKIVKTRQECNQ
jgi:apolipoprotein D and lipocalin family protein